MRQVGGGEVVVVATSSFQEDLPQTLISALVVAAGGRSGLARPHRIADTSRDQFLSCWTLPLLFPPCDHLRERTAVVRKERL
ncbi:MAG TPA: hypothetical protein VEL31_18525, partial [Ktedonobacteraceae bacterium]|nr:hypothetical protein [Ktedonobacteraceae bacterium]